MAKAWLQSINSNEKRDFPIKKFSFWIDALIQFNESNSKVYLEEVREVLYCNDIPIKEHLKMIISAKKQGVVKMGKIPILRCFTGELCGYLAVDENNRREGLSVTPACNFLLTNRESALLIEPEELADALPEFACNIPEDILEEITERRKHIRNAERSG